MIFDNDPLKANYCSSIMIITCFYIFVCVSMTFNFFIASLLFKLWASIGGVVWCSLEWRRRRVLCVSIDASEEIFVKLTKHAINTT